MTNIPRKLPSKSVPRINNVKSKNTTGDIFEVKDLNDEDDKFIYGVSCLSDKDFKRFWNEYYIERINTRYECCKGNILLQKQQLRESKDRKEILMEYINMLESEECKEAEAVLIPKAIHDALFDEETEEPLVPINLDKVKTQLDYTILGDKLHNAEKHKSTISIKLGNAIIKKNRQQASLLLCEYKNALDDLVAINEELANTGRFTQWEEFIDEREMTSKKGQGAFMNACKYAKKNYEFLKGATTILINEYYRL